MKAIADSLFSGHQELAAIFIGYTVESSRIQRDDKGNSKGVGFAR